MIIKIPIEVTQTGEGLKATVKGLEEIDKSAKMAQKGVKGVAEGFASGTSKAAHFADATGRVSTTLARSADTLGLNAAAFRSLDDVMDIAELGFNNLTRAAVGFNAASVGVAGAGLAIGLSIGKWLNTFPAVQKAADSLFHSMFRLVGLAPEIIASAGPIADFSKKMGASDLAAKGKQIESMRAGGMTTTEIAKFYGDGLTTAMKEQLGLSEKQVKLDEKRVAAAKKHKEEIRQLIEMMGGPKVNFRDALSVNFKKDLMGSAMATSLNLSDSRASVGGGGGANVLGALMGGGIATSLNISWSKERALEADAAKRAKEETQQLINTFGTLSQQLTNLSQTVGGFAGKLLGIASALSSGAGGVMSGLSAWKSSTGGGLMGFLGKFSAGLGIVGSAIGAVGGLIGGIKSLFGGKSKEEKAAEAAAKAQKDADAKAAIESAKQVKLEGLKSAQAAAESLMERMSKGGMSEGLTASLGTLIGKVQDALLKSGLGYMASGALRSSEAFMGAQGAAGDVAQLLAGMRAGGALDSGLMGAAGASARELQTQAVEAAKAAGLGPEEATKAGFGAMVPLLREMLNASIASGEKLSADQQALLDEAKANGITILADPMVESVAVQKDMLGELKRMNGSGGGSPDASFASGTRGLRLVKRNMLAQIHEGEGLYVATKDEMSRMSYRSFSRGSDDDTAGTWGGRGGNVPVIVGGSSEGTASGETSSGATGGQSVEDIIQAAVAQLTPITLQNPVSVQIVDQSPVKTVEGQRAFGRLCVGEVERALQQSRGSLRVMIEQISRKAVA